MYRICQLIWAIFMVGIMSYLVGWKDWSLWTFFFYGIIWFAAAAVMYGGGELDLTKIKTVRREVVE